MTRRNWRLLFGLPAAPVMAPAAALVFACSGGPLASGDGEPSAPLPAVEGSTIAPATVPTPPPPGSSFTGPAGASFASCADTAPSFRSSAPPPLSPHFVIALLDDDGAPYGFTDHHSVPFPTPWISATEADGGVFPGTKELVGAGCASPASPGHCVYDSLVDSYEQSLQTTVPGIVQHQFLVYNLTWTGDSPGGVDSAGKTLPAVGNFTIESSARQWFYNGSTENTTAVYTAMQSVVARYQVPAGGVDNGVDAQMLHCIYVLARNATTNKLYASGYHAAIAQSHDPINWPD